MDEAHETLSGPATKRILEREHREYGKPEYERLAGISVAHLYNLRKQRRYHERRLNYSKTWPTQVAIGKRRRPQPEGQPGYLRIDTVHQGDLDGIKGVYHINAVDEVTQWQVMGYAVQIGETWLLPVLEQILQQFSSGTDDPNSLSRPSWTVSRKLESNKPRVPERMRSCTAGSDNIRGISMVPIIVEKITKKFFSLSCFRRLPMPSVYEDRPSRHASTPDQPAVRQLLFSPRSYQECRGQSDLSH